LRAVLEHWCFIKARWYNDKQRQTRGGAQFVRAARYEAIACTKSTSHQTDVTFVNLETTRGNYLLAAELGRNDISLRNDCCSCVHAILFRRAIPDFLWLLSAPILSFLPSSFHSPSPSLPLTVCVTARGDTRGKSFRSSSWTVIVDVRYWRFR
jgi:hypothetical protein